ncbi:MAG: transposase [Candidatus Methanoperedens sp.]|nr:transposase [Candidatus Methanoperedens sp.]
MSFIRYKKFGNKEYAYEITAYWDPEQKKSRQLSKYLGVVVDKEAKIFVKKNTQKCDVEKLILDFGDAHILHEFLKKIKLYDILFKVFKEKTNYLLAMIYYRLCHPSAMQYAQIWFQGSFSKLLFKDIDLSSQRISEFLEDIGNEKLQREYFENHISFVSQSKEGIIIDTTAMPNQIHFPFNEWGYNDGAIDKQIKLLFVIDRERSLPLYFRYLPGNIVDVSSLSTTVEELKKFGVKSSFVLVDAGFFSETNIKGLYTEVIDFLTRLPSRRKLYKDLVKQEAQDIETFKNAVKYGKRALFVKQKKIDLYGKEVYAHIILDPERKGQETKKVLINALDEYETDEDNIEFELMNSGLFILISSFEIDKKEVVPFYYMRLIVEKLIGFAKDDLNLLPLRAHQEITLRGYLLLIFIILTVFALLKEKLGSEYTVEEILLTMRNLKCKVYDTEIIVQELAKQQKEIIEKLEILVPKKSGV